MIFCFEAQLRFEGYNAFILSKNLVPVFVDTEMIHKKLVDDLKSSKKEKVPNLVLPFISPYLDLVSKNNESWRKIYIFLIT